MRLRSKTGREQRLGRLGKEPGKVGALLLGEVLDPMNRFEKDDGLLRSLAAIACHTVA